MFPITSVRIIYRALTQGSANGGTRLGAALAYYALFSIAPLLLLAIYTAGLVFGEDAARGKVREQLDSLMGSTIAATVEMMIQTAAQQPSATWPFAISILLMAFGALGGFLHVRSALCMIWKLEPPNGGTWFDLIRDYLLALWMVLI